MLNTAVQRAIEARYVGCFDGDVDLFTVKVDGAEAQFERYDDNVWPKGNRDGYVPSDVHAAIIKLADEESGRRERRHQERAAREKAERISRLKAEADAYGCSVDTLLIVESLGRVETHLKWISSSLESR